MADTLPSRQPVTLYDANGKPLAVADGQSVNGTRGVLLMGVDAAGVGRRFKLNPDGTMPITATISAEGIATEATLVQCRVILQQILDAQGGASAYVSDESGAGLAGLINGTNKAFTTSAHYKGGSTKLYWNGVRLREGLAYDYIESVDHQTLTLAVAPVENDTLVVDYLVGA